MKRVNGIRRIGLLGIGVTAQLLAACAATPQPSVSGFLSSYEGLQVDPADTSLLWWEQEAFSWANYHGVMLEPLSFYYHPEAQGRELTPEELKELSDAFHDAVVEELGENYAVVSEPAPGILRVRCAITDVIPSGPAVNMLTASVAFVAVDVGGAAIEVEFFDAVSGERMAAAVDRKLGKPIDGPVNFSRYGQAKRAFRAWARDLRRAFQTNP